VKTYLFDFDGTLVDSMPTYIKAMLHILDENNVKYSSDIVKIITPLGYINTAKYFISLGINLSEEKIVSKMQTYALNQYTNHIQAKNNVVVVLNKLKKEGNSLNILTASPHSVLDPCLKRLNIYHLFDNIWSCDDFSTTKTDPQIYYKIASILNININNLMFLDDNINGLKTASEIGVKTIGVYDASSEEYTSQIKKITQKFIYDFNELI